MNKLINWFRSLSIYYKINGFIISMILLLSFIMSMIMMETTSRLLDQQIEKRGAEVGSYIAALSQNDILLDDHYALYDRINKTKNNTEDVRYVLISDTAGRVLAHTFPDGLPEGLPLQRSLPTLPEASPEYMPPLPDETYQVVRLNSNEGPIREIVVPIENGNIGYVHVGMSEKSTQMLLRRKIDDFFILTLLFCLLSVAAATYLAHIITSPVSKLVRAAEQIRQGNLSVQTDATAPDEIGHLSAVFNEMAASLQQKETENNRLLSELRAKEAMRAVLMSKLFTIQEEERQRLSRELHDETGQSLASLLAYMKLLMSKLEDEQQKELLSGARDVAINVLEGLRKMAVELRPPVLDDLGITAAMAKYINNFSKQQELPVSFTAPDDKIIVSNEVSLALYRILQESLTNIAKHAAATAVWITLTVEAKVVTLTIRDNGKGIRPGALEDARKHNRLGLYGMQERAELIGGSLTFHSGTTEGTTIIVLLPL